MHIKILEESRLLHASLLLVNGPQMIKLTSMEFDVCSSENIGLKIVVSQEMKYPKKASKKA